MGRKRDIAKRVVGPVAARAGNLDLLARLYGTDKYEHRFTTYYRRHFAKRRKNVRSVLEIGVGGTTSAWGHEAPEGGMSLRMWRDYFPNASIVGVDIYAKNVAGERISFEQGDQSDPDFLATVAAKHGPFDIVIDDGSHVGHHVQASFRHLWDAVKPGGFYVIEDLAAAYEEMYAGGPPGTPDTAAALIKDQVDQTIRRSSQPVAVPSPERPVAGLHLYADLVFFEKSH